MRFGQPSARSPSYSRRIQLKIFRLRSSWKMGVFHRLESKVVHEFRRKPSYFQVERLDVKVMKWSTWQRKRSSRVESRNRVVERSDQSLIGEIRSRALLGQHGRVYHNSLQAVDQNCTLSIMMILPSLCIYSDDLEDK